ncbi:MAG TPA: S8 family serine peptidase [Bacteroidia bacterium]|nr:S8 family serine peptidase [Bacteroidia bacterium]HNT79497.1 S8 family serine peptidase [Bacteroidia bacterium]
MKSIICALLCCLTIFQSQAQFSLSPSVSQSDYQSNTIVLKVKGEYRNYCSKQRIAIPAIDALIGKQIVSLKKMFPEKETPTQKYDRHGKSLVDLSLIYEVTTSSKTDLIKEINRLIRTNLFEFVEPKYIPSVSFTPNDPSLAFQYYLTNINAYAAWDISQGDTNMVIGITDTGTDWDHPDLVDNIKYNYDDLINGLDDDNDGYTDNYRGWDLGENDNDPMVNINPHGSHVSGCSSASTNNNIGVAGPGYRCKFLPVKISNAAGALTHAYEGIVYAADQGCKIINCSWGSNGGGSFGQTIIDYATINKGSLVIGAAGNFNNNIPFFPAAYDKVLSVAATNSSDTKASFSNYGGFVDVCAPGDNIYSTYFNNGYSFQGGTSMAAPICAGATGVVWSMFPSLSALQIAEKMRVTCDNIYGISGNTPYVDQLGKGRIDMVNALTQNGPAVRYENIVYADYNNNSFVVNDTIRIAGDFINYLDATSNLVATLTSSSPYITFLNSSVNVGALATLATLNNGANPFSFKINSNAPPNVKVILKLSLTDGTYSDFQLLEVSINVDYINVYENLISTTVTSNSRIGYSGANQQDGIGFIYNASGTMLYEGGLMVGQNTSVSDGMRGSPAGAIDNDFFSMNRVNYVIPSVKSDLDLTGLMNDNQNTMPMDLRVNHRFYVWSDPVNAKYVIFEYGIKNNGSTILNALHAGIFCDWDIMDYNKNKVAEDAALRMGYAWSTEANGLYAGIKLLTQGPFYHYGIDNVSGGAGGIDMFNGYDSQEKFQSMSSMRSTAGGTGIGNDIIDVVGTGPFNINPGDSVVVAFALIGGDSLIDIQASAVAAQIKYDAISSVLENQNSSALKTYPNPVSNGMVYFNISANLKETIRMDWFSVSGQKVKSAEVNTEELNKGYNIEDLKNGIYQVRFVSGELNYSTKVIVMQ